MGIDYDGGMIVGVRAEDIPEEVYADFDDLYDWYESKGMTRYSPWYDADLDACTVGIEITNDVGITQLDSFMLEVKAAFIKVEDLTTIKPELSGMQNIW